MADTTLIDQMIDAWEHDWSHAVQYFQARTGLTFDQSMLFLVLQSMFGNNTLRVRAEERYAKDIRQHDARMDRVMKMLEADWKDHHNGDEWKDE